MSTRKYLRERKKALSHQFKKEPTEGLKRAIAELDFIFEKLKEYDKERSSASIPNQPDYRSWP